MEEQREKPWQVKILHPGSEKGVTTGEITQVLDAATGKAIPLVYRIKFESAPDEIASCEIHTYAVLTEIDTEATIIGTDPKEVLAVLKGALESAGVSEAAYQSVYTAVADTLYQK